MQSLCYENLFLFMLKLKLITITTISHLDLFWKRDWGELGMAYWKIGTERAQLAKKDAHEMQWRPEMCGWRERRVLSKRNRGINRKEDIALASPILIQKKTIMLQWWEYLCFADPPRIDVENDEKINCCYCFVDRKNTCPAFKVWSACFGFALLKWIFFAINRDQTKAYCLS